MRKIFALTAAFALAGCLGPKQHGGPGNPDDPTVPPGGSPPPTPGDDCGQQSFPIVTSRLSPNIMLVVDESGSMQDPIGGASTSKWQALKGAVDDLLAKQKSTAQWGLSIFPHTPADECSAGQVDVAVGPNTTAAILGRIDALDDATIGGSTPTEQTLQALLGSTAGLSDPSRANYVLLMTDGLPNCGGNGRAVSGVIGQLYAQTPSVRTFVVGIGDGTSSNPRTLNDWADAGHTARAGATKYYQVNTASDLAAAFTDIVSGVAQCSYVLTMKPKDASLVVGYLDGRPVADDAANGTSYEAGANTLVFHGQSCQAIKSGMVRQIEVRYGCPPPAIP